MMSYADQNTAENGKYLKYSKPSAFYLSTKKDFFTSNKELLEKSQQHNKIYSEQPKRKVCKVCQSMLPPNTDFQSHGVGYLFCVNCSHLNGEFEDTKSFAEKLYVSEHGVDYSKNYIDDDYSKRTTDIYIPKVEFLLEALPTQRIEVLDVGCGGGYFVYALLQKEIPATGLDVSETMVDYGNHQITLHMQKTPLINVDEQGFYESIIKTDASVISAIGVIEHLREPQKIFNAFQKSNAKHIYYSVPMFSFSVALENVFPNVFPRQLSGGHTHLFTESSIKMMNEIMGVEPIAEWRFGTDVMDLYRHVMISLQCNQASQKVLDFLRIGFAEKIDELQPIFDKNHFCSEIHLIASKK